MSEKPNLIVITGPTATGKTALGVAVAKALNGEVVGADSMQIYRHMDIGTAKPMPEEMENIPHHMVDMVSPLESFSVSRYVEQATQVVDDILARGKVPIVVERACISTLCCPDGSLRKPSPTQKSAPCWSSSMTPTGARCCCKCSGALTRSGRKSSTRRISAGLSGPLKFSF